MKLIKKDWVYIPEIDKRIRLLTDENGSIKFVNRLDIEKLKDDNLRVLTKEESSFLIGYLNVNIRIGYLLFNDKYINLFYKFQNEPSTINDFYFKSIDNYYGFLGRLQKEIEYHCCNDKYSFMCFVTNID